MTTIKLGGEELRLVRPKGRAGRKLIVKVQETLRLVSPVIAATDLGKSEAVLADMLFDVTNQLFTDEKLAFEDEILPALYMHSELGLSKEEAMERLEQIDDPPFQILMQYIQAINFWTGITEQEQKEVQEAVKKSRAAKKEAEEE
jgi:hypothetical protein